MADVKHSSGLLTDPEPTYNEEKTAAQLDDERQTSIMSHTRSAYEIEEDDTPAIEQQLHNEGAVLISNEHPSSKPKLEASASFAAEMHEIQAAERAAREKKRQAEEIEEKKRAEKHEKELAAKLEEAQELDPEEIRERAKEENYEKNQKQLYPDAIPAANEVEQKIFKKDEGTGNQIAGRAKLEFVFDDKLHRTINFAIIFNLLGLVFTVAGIMFDRFNIFIERIFIIFGIIVFISTIIWLHFNIFNTRHHEVPSEVSRRFVYATIIPFIIMRIPFVTACSQLPIVGHIIGPLIGCAFASSLHYWFINSHGVEVSTKDTIINSFGFYVIYAIIIATFSSLDSTTPAAFIDISLTVLGVFFGDYIAMILANKSHK